MEEEPSDKLGSLKLHDLIFVTIGIVTPVEGDLAITKFEDTVIADGYPVRIPAKIFQDTRRTVKGRFAIDDPLLMIELSSECFESLWMSEVIDNAGEGELFCFITLFKRIQEFPPEQG